LRRHIPDRFLTRADFDEAFSKFTEEAPKYAQTVDDNRLKLYAFQYLHFLQGKAKGDSARQVPYRFASSPISSLIRFHLNELFQDCFRQNAA